MSSTLTFNPHFTPPLPRRRLRPTGSGAVKAFRRADFDGLAARVVSGEALRDAWRGANSGLETLAFEARRAAERLDRRFAVSRRLDSACRAAVATARGVEQEYGIGRQLRTFSVDFSRNWPRYRRELKGFMDTPLGKSFGVIFLIWFVLSGWWFRFIVISMWVLPLASPLLIGLGRTLANNFVIEGACPACKKQFMGYRNQVVRCTSCRNVVWQPRDGPGTSEPDIIDIEIDDK